MTSPADELLQAVQHLRAEVADFETAEAAPWLQVADQLDQIAAFWIDQPEQRWPTFDGLPAALARAINTTASTSERAAPSPAHPADPTDRTKPPWPGTDDPAVLARACVCFAARYPRPHTVGEHTNCDGKRCGACHSCVSVAVFVDSHPKTPSATTTLEAPR